MERMIDSLFLEVSQEKEYAQKLEDYTRETDTKIYELIINPAYEKDFKTGSELESIFVSALCNRERFGFEQGFKYAMRLRYE